MDRLGRGDNLSSVVSDKKVKERDFTLDGIRFIAIYMVILIHVSAKGFPSMGEHWWAINFYDSISRGAVPLFFMVSGALLLSKETSARTSLKRAWRIAVPLFVWSMIYLSWFRYTGTEFPHWIRTTLRTPVAPHLWYLYTLIGVYIFLPVMVGFCKIQDRSAQYLALAGCFFGSCIAPMLYALTQKTYIGVEFNFLPLYAGYVVAGWMLYNQLDWKRAPVALAAAVWALCAAATAVFTWQHSIKLGRADETFYIYSSPFVVIGAISSFVLLRALMTRLFQNSEKVKNFLANAGKLNFGIYLVHVLVMFWLDLNGMDYRFANPWIAIPITALAIFVLSAALVYVMQKIPLVRQAVPA